MNRTHQRPRRRGFLHGGEQGQALVLWALCLTVIIGMAGLVIDGSNYQNTKRQLQNAADAAAFAGAQDLKPTDCTLKTQAQTDAQTWAFKNPPSGSSVTYDTVYQTTQACDTIAVQVSKTPSLFLMQVLGIAPRTVSAKAAARVQATPNTVESCVWDNTNANCPAYAIWYMDNWNGSSWGGSCHAVQFGDIVEWTGNNWVNDSVCDGHPGPSWTSSSNNFKGWFHNYVSGPCNVNTTECAGEIVTGGGNACTTQAPFLQAANNAYNNGTPFIVAMLNHESGTGSNTQVTIENWVAIRLDISQNAKSNGGAFPLSMPIGTCSFTAYGKVVSYTGTPPGFQTGGGTPPPPGGACGTGVGICVTTVSAPKLVQPTASP